MKISVIRADITKMKVDAIVNAANSSLLGGGGVDGAIHRAGGKDILEECMQIRNRQGKCRTGQAVYTTAGDLPSKYVIHTVGPVWNEGMAGEEEKLGECYSNSLVVAEELKVASIAFPNISTGIYGYPRDKAAKVAIDVVKSFEAESLQEVIFVCFDENNLKYYQHLMD